MPEKEDRSSDVWEGARRGLGWGVGFLSVLGLAGALRRGSRASVKEAMKGVLRVRRLGAEAAERMQDIYAEAESEYRAEALSGEET